MGGPSSTAIPAHISKPTLAGETGLESRVPKAGRRQRYTLVSATKEGKRTTINVIERAVATEQRQSKSPPWLRLKVPLRRWLCLSPSSVADGVIVCSSRFAAAPYSHANEPHTVAAGQRRKYRAPQDEKCVQPLHPPDFVTDRVALALPPYGPYGDVSCPPSPAVHSRLLASICATLPTLTLRSRSVCFVVSSAGAVAAPNNIMYDKRVVRGNTYAAQILPAVRAPCPSALRHAHRRDRHFPCRVAPGAWAIRMAGLRAPSARAGVLPSVYIACGGRSSAGGVVARAGRTENTVAACAGCPDC